MKENKQDDASSAFRDLFEIVKTLRGPGGCPWDKEQTAKTLRGDLLEETYECIDAINRNDTENLREELGDIFLLATMISYIKEEEGAFDIKSVLKEISEKLVRRHPHVFGDSKITDSDEVVEEWDRIKRDVEGKKGNGSILNTVPATLPPLEKAYRYQKKAAKAGFDWRERAEVIAKVFEEISELQELSPEEEPEAVEQELGDVLFAVINLCRHYGKDPAIALNNTNNKFFKRFNYIENAMESMGKTLSKDEFDLMDNLWNEAKSREK
jgi:tetrapyrrole methylase family protein / MazG family protein